MGRSARPPLRRLAVALPFLALVLVSCIASPPVTGRLSVSGSSTVEPISTRMAELFEDVAPEILVDIDGPGTGDGFQLFCRGEADIANASRPIKAEEVALCESNGVEFIELRVAFDGLTMLTSGDNSTVECLSLIDLYALIGPESGDVRNWHDAEDLARELGSDTSFPDTSFELHAPGQESGTYDAFIELALDDITTERFEAGHLEPSADDPEEPAALIREFPGQSDDNVILSGVAGSESGLGWVGFAFAEGAGDRVKELAIDGGDGCVDPTAATIADGRYPLSRDLFIYVRSAKASDGSPLADYVDFYLSDAGQDAVPEVGYVPLDAASLEDTRQVWQAREPGTRDGGD